MTAVRGPARTGLDVEVRKYPRQHYLAIEIDARVDHVGEAVSTGFARLFTYFGAAGIAVAGPPFLVSSPPVRGSMHLTVAVPTAAAGMPAGDIYPGVLLPGDAAVVLHRGDYESIGPLYAELEAWIRAQGRTPAGPPREVYLNGPDDVASADEYLTELVWPIV